MYLSNSLRVPLESFSPLTNQFISISFRIFSTRKCFFSPRFLTFWPEMKENIEETIEDCTLVTLEKVIVLNFYNYEWESFKKPHVISDLEVEKQQRQIIFCTVAMKT